MSTPNNKKRSAASARTKRSARFIEGLAQTSYPALLAVWIVAVIWFGVIYTLLSYLPGSHGLTPLEQQGLAARLGNGIYFSIITATSLGYGDLAPLGFSKWLASAESIFGVTVLALFIAKLLSHRHDTALERIHRLSFQNLSFTTREELHIVRKDFDAVLTDAERGTLPSGAWENLATAYRTTQTVLTGIIDFYEQPDGMYTIDAMREKLLLGAVLRTLARIDRLLRVLTDRRIAWKRHAASFTELKKLIRVTDVVLRRWEARTPHRRPEAFAELWRVVRRCRAHLGPPPKVPRT